jgi:hypothetical protein
MAKKQPKDASRTAPPSGPASIPGASRAPTSGTDPRLTPGEQPDGSWIIDLGHEEPIYGPVPSRDRAARGFANAASNTFGLLKPEVVAVDGGWRDARMLDGDFAGWLCPHVHATPKEAEDCPKKESILGPRER